MLVVNQGWRNIRYIVSRMANHTPFFKGEGDILPTILSMLQLYHEELLKCHTWYLFVITKMCVNFDQRHFTGFKVTRTNYVK